MTLGSGIYVGWVGAATAIFVSVLYFMGMSFLCISDFLGLIQDMKGSCIMTSLSMAEMATS